MYSPNLGINMLGKLLSIAHNTFRETIRQPVYAVIIVAAIFLFIVSPSLTMYSLDNDDKLLLELGLSTLFIAGLFISIFSAANSITEEVQTKTIITTLSKPVPRPIFILGKYLGVASAVFIAHYLFTSAHFIAIRHGVMSTASDEHDMTVVLTATGTIGLTIIISGFLSYFYDSKFTSTAVITASILTTFSLIFLTFIDRDWKYNPAGNGFDIFNVYASAMLFIALLAICAIALMFASRFNILITLSLCICVFLLGLISDYVFGRFADTYLWAKIGRMLVPNLQTFWITDAIYEKSQIPFKYVLMTASYGLSYTIGILFLTIALFQKRQIG
ncbi:MAG: hypothetical protein K8R02_09190 [Anaerohalosphaeraceae bacterium]|nr:hypothetical protein [Anaerohalosphaeraceae bacterium]